MDADSIIISIRKILRAVNLESKRIQKEYGLSIPQVLALNFIEKQDKFSTTLKAVASYLNLNASTTTGIIQRLEQKGYVYKSVNEEDKRATFIHLTALGKETLNQLPKLMHNQLAEKLEKASDEQKAALRKSLNDVITFMGIENVDAAPVITLDDLTS